MLRLVGAKEIKVPLDDAGSASSHEHHNELLKGFLQSHRIRNHSDRTFQHASWLLNGWFQSHGNSSRPLYTWEAMRPIEGRRRIVQYGQALLDSEVANQTIRSYLGQLRAYFDYVLEHPYVSVTGSKEPCSIISLYGPIEQPVSEYDVPQHSFNGATKGLPLDPGKLRDFYKVLKNHYLNQGRLRHVHARNYAMVILAGESGLRADELLKLDSKKDLFFESKKLQTQNAKASRGSGKRARITLFTPLARDTIRFYLSNHRPHLKGSEGNDLLFPSSFKGCRLTYTTVASALRKMVSVASKHDCPVSPHLTWHWFRRLFATRFIEQFPNKLDVLLSLMGHQSPSTIHAYIHHSQAWMDDQIQAVMEKVDFDGY